MPRKTYVRPPRPDSHLLAKFSPCKHPSPEEEAVRRKLQASGVALIPELYSPVASGQAVINPVATDPLVIVMPRDVDAYNAYYSLNNTNVTTGWVETPYTENPTPRRFALVYNPTIERWISHGEGGPTNDFTFGAWYSTDDGDTWVQEQNGDRFTTIRDMAAQDEYTVAVGDNSIIARTDNGANWSNAEVIGSSNFTAVMGIGNQKWIAVGSNGTILRDDTFNGLYFEPTASIPASATGGFYDLCKIGSRIFVCGDISFASSQNGETGIWYSDDEGDTWTATTTANPSEGGFAVILGSDDNSRVVGVMSGGYGAARYISSDGGLTYSNTGPEPLNYNYFDIIYDSVIEAFIFATSQSAFGPSNPEYPTVAVSTDGGATVQVGYAGNSSFEGTWSTAVASKHEVGK